MKAILCLMLAALACSFTIEHLKLAPGERWTLSTGGVGGVSVKRWAAKKGEEQTQEGDLTQLAPGERWTLGTGGVGGVSVKRWAAKGEE